MNIRFKVKNFTKNDSLDLYFGALENIQVDGLECQNFVPDE